MRVVICKVDSSIQYNARNLNDLSFFKRYGKISYQCYEKLLKNKVVEIGYFKFEEFFNSKQIKLKTNNLNINTFYEIHKNEVIGDKLKSYFNLNELSGYKTYFYVCF